MNASLRWMTLGAMGVEFAVCVAACAVLGVELDKRFGTEPFAVLGLTVAGSVGGLYRLVYVANRSAGSVSGKSAPDSERKDREEEPDNRL